MGSPEQNKIDIKIDDNANNVEAKVPAIGRVLSFQAMLTLNKFREENALCDATLVVDDGTQFPVHRNILCACSSYFQALFITSAPPESDSIPIHIPGVESHTMNNILQYAYLRSLNLTENNVAPLLLATDYFCMDQAQEVCFEFFKSLVNPKNCFGVLLFARDHLYKSLEQSTMNYILRNIVQIAEESEEVLHVSVDDISEVLESDELNVKSEETVWKLIIRWIDFEPSERKQHIVRLMKHVRLGLLDTQYFLKEVKEHPYVVGNQDCRPVIIETLKFLYDLEIIAQKDGEFPTPQIARPRIPHEILFAIGGWSGGSPTDFVESYDTRADRWVTVEQVDPMGPRAYHGTAVIGPYIYVIGGFDGTEYYNSCRRFNAVTKVWQEIAPMNYKRCYVSIAIYGDVIYAMGGYNGQRRQASAEKYNYKENQWSLIAPMNVERSDASATTLNDKIYITGGFNGHDCLNTCEVYNPQADQWTFIEPMLSQRSGVSCVAYHDCIYVIGGFNGMARMSSGEKYCPKSKSWSVVPDMYNPRSNFAIEVIDDMIFAIGGFNGVTTIYHVECYDARTNEWYEATDMNIYRSALSACVISGLPNVYDYIHKDRDNLIEEKRQKLLAIENRISESDDARNTNSVEFVIPDRSGSFQMLDLEP